MSESGFWYNTEHGTAARRVTGGRAQDMKAITTRLRYLLVLLLAAAWVAGPCRAPSGGGDEAEAGGASSGPRVLRVYSALDPNETKIYFSEYEKYTAARGEPVKMQWVRLSSGGVLSRITQEKGKPSMGLWFGGPSTDFIDAAHNGLLEPYRPSIKGFSLDPQMRDPQWRWTGFYFGAIGFASNRNMLERLGLAPPQSWKDLLDPRYENNVSVAYPYQSGTAYTVLSSLAQSMGEGPALDYLRALDRNVHHYNKSGSACVTQAGLGEVAACVAFSHDILKKGPGQGFPVALSFPADGTGFEIGAMALIRNGPDHNEARRFMDWALGRQAQSLMQQWYRIPLNPHAERAQGIVPAHELNLIRYDAIKAGKDKRRLIEEWRLATGQ